MVLDVVYEVYRAFALGQALTSSSLVGGSSGKSGSGTLRVTDQRHELKARKDLFFSILSFSREISTENA
jgi:hypothetical protein